MSWFTMENDLPDRTKPSWQPGKRFWWVLGLIGALIFGLLLFVKNQDPTSALRPPIKSVEIQGEWGTSRLEVYAIDVASTHSLEYEPGPWKFSGSTGRSGRSSGGLSVNHRLKNDSVVSGTLEYSDGADPLLLEILYRDESGNPKNLTRVRGLGRYTTDGRSEMKLIFDPTGQLAKWSSSPLGSEALPMSVEVSDGKNWHPMTGPIIPFRNDPRGILLADSFSRDQPVLNFRARLNGGEPVEFTIPNPAPRKRDATWTADPEPWERTLSTGKLAMTLPKPSLTPTGLVATPLLAFEPFDSGQVEKAFYAECDEIQDDYGNATNGRRFQLVGEPDFIRYHVQVQSTGFRRLVVDPSWEPLATGVAPKGGASLELTLEPASRRLGIEKFLLEPASGQSWKITWSGTSGNLNPLGNLMAYLVLDGETQSLPSRRRGGGGGHGEDGFSYETHLALELPEGKSFTLYFRKHPAPEKLHFTVPIERIRGAK